MGIGIVVTSELIASVVYPSCVHSCVTHGKKNGQRILVALNGSDFKEAAGAEMGQEGGTNIKN